MNIALIGNGQLGSRHLQALALLEQSMKIFLVDPDEAQQRIAIDRFRQIEGFEKHELYAFRQLVDLPVTQLDMAVIATNSTVRYQVIRELLSICSVRFLVLEKVLFQHPDHYQEMGKLFSQQEIKVYVNCPRRMYPAYRKIKSMLDGTESLRMEVVGNQWGLGCNGIHFIDLFRWLGGEPITEWVNELNEGHIASKRTEYAEFTGTLSGYTSSGYHLSLTCFPEGLPNTSVRISTPEVRIFIAESLGQVWVEKVDREQITLDQFTYQVLYQSELTHQVVQDLLYKETCELTPYNESEELHLPFIKLIIEHYNSNIEQKTDLCPIT